MAQVAVTVGYDSDTVRSVCSTLLDTETVPSRAMVLLRRGIVGAARAVAGDDAEIEIVDQEAYSVVVLDSRFDWRIDRDREQRLRELVTAIIDGLDWLCETDKEV